MRELSVVSEAGLIVSSRGGDGIVRYLLIERPGDWSLPKGHPEVGEGLVAAALREVQEESSVRCVVAGPAGVFSYQAEGERREVHFFHASYTGPVEPPRALDDVSQTLWLSREDAAAKLTYPDLREFFLGATGTLPAWPHASQIPAGRARRSARLDRLMIAIEVFAAEFAVARSQSSVSPEAALAWRPTVEQLLARADELAADRRIDAAWECLHCAQRLALNELSAAERQAYGVALVTEIESKLSGWRKTAASTLLASPDDNHDTEISTASLAEAKRLRDESSVNVYLKRRLGGLSVKIAAGLLTAILVFLGVAVTFGWFEGLDVDPETFVLTNGGLFLGSLILGAFGAMLSLALDQRGASLVTPRIYELATAHFVVPVARLAIGGASGVLVVAATQSSLAETGQPWAILTAIPAGFSERLVRRSVASLETTAQGQ